MREALALNWEADSANSDTLSECWPHLLAPSPTKAGLGTWRVPSSLCLRDSPLLLKKTVIWKDTKYNQGPYLLWRKSRAFCVRCEIRRIVNSVSFNLTLLLVFFFRRWTRFKKSTREVTEVCKEVMEISCEDYMSHLHGDELIPTHGTPTVGNGHPQYW